MKHNDERQRMCEAAIAQLKVLGARRVDHVLDLGAADLELAVSLRSHGYRGLYSPVTEHLDGSLDLWQPPDYVDWAVAIDVLDKVISPERLVSALRVCARHGVVLVERPEQFTMGDFAKWGYIAEPPTDNMIVGWFDRMTLSRPSERVS